MRNPSKELFTFTKSERRGITVLLFIIASLLLANIFMPFFVSDESSNFAQFAKEIEIFEKQFQQDTSSNSNKIYKKQNIISEENTFAAQDKNDDELHSYYEKKNYNKPQYEKRTYNYEKLSINLNTADTLELVQLRGIGSVFANRIIKFRNKLGGFFEPEQLYEIYGFDSVKYELIQEEIFVDEGDIVKIKLNEATVKDLIKHPYIDYKLAYAISKQRFRKKFESVDELKAVYLVNDTLFRKLVPYFSIE